MNDKDLTKKDKDIIERDKVIRSFYKFLECLKFDLEEMVKSIKNFLED